jgi:glucose-1-phosphate thymidylyltransferase
MWGERHRGGALMRAVILAGGKGERLRPLTDNTRKAFLPLGERRVIDYLLDKIPQWVLVTTSQDDSGAASAIANCLDQSTATAVLFGDNYFEADLHDFFFRYGGCTVAGVYDVGSVDIARDLGVVSLDRNGFIQEFEEKPGKPKSTLVSIGIYRFPPVVFPLIRQFAFMYPKANAGEVIMHLLKKGIPVCAHVIEGPWFDIGTMDSYLAAWDYIRRQSSVKKRQHKLMLQCDGKEDIVYCVKCGMSTPPMPHDDSASMEEMFQKAEAQGTLGYNEDLKGKGIPGIVSIDEL